MLFALPSESDSEAEPDDGAHEELYNLGLHSSELSEPQSLIVNAQLRGNRGALTTATTVSTVSDAPAARGCPEPGDVQSTTSVVRPHRSRRAATSATTVPAVADPGDVQSMTSLGRAHRSHRAAATAVLGSASAAQGSDVDSDSVDLESTDELDVDDSGWGDDFSQFDMQFCDKNPNLKSSLDSRAKESDYFRLLFTDSIVDNIVEQTNLYATQPKPQIIRSSTGTRVHKTLPTQNWVPTTKGEIEAFIGMSILMAIHQLPEMQHYWSSDPMLSVPAISNVMTSKRFKKITESIHVNNNANNLPRTDPHHDKLHKVRPLIDDLNKSISGAYSSSNCVSIDESMIPFKGRSSLKQYMPMKPVKRGYKVWCIADARTGYVLQFEIYTGKEIEPSPDNFGLGERVVLKLAECLDQSCEIVAFDNFFTTVTVMEELLSRGFHAVGTVRPTRRGLPPMLKEKSKLERGQHLYKTKGQLAAIKWQDKRPVTMLSTGFDPTETMQIQRTNKDGTKSMFSCPIAVARYNAIMGGVDRFDQLRGCYAIGRRSVKWWHRILFYLIDMAVVNSFILWTVNRDSDMSFDQLTYRLRLARQLIGDFTSRKRRGPSAVAFLSHKRHVPDDVRTVGKHLPTQGSTFRRCRLCSSATREKRTRYICDVCNVPLCAAPCFKKFHEK